MPELSLSEFADRINEIMPVMMREFVRQQSTTIYKITLPQFVIMLFLSKHKGAKMSDLAKSMSVSTPAMTGLVERLVRDRYVTRLYDTKDRRIVKVQLTQKGITAVKNIHKQRKKLIIKIFGKLSQKEREDYLRILTRIKDSLK